MSTTVPVRPADGQAESSGEAFVAEEVRLIRTGRVRSVWWNAVPLAIALVAVVGGGTLFLSGFAIGRQAVTDPGTPATGARLFQPFWDTYHTISDRYAGGPVDQQKLVQGAIHGMIDSLGDPYSQYLTAEQYHDNLQSISGQFEGIGAQLSSKGPDGAEGCPTIGKACRLFVVNPLTGSPAEKAGLLANDVIVAIDGKSIDGSTADAARTSLRGRRGTVVKVSIVRGTAHRDIAITRDVIQQQEVVSRVLDSGRVGYVHLIGFSDNAANSLTSELAAAVKAGRKKIILDLRGDPGGYVTAARKVASQFMRDGVVFWEEDAQGNLESTAVSPGGVATDPAVKVVCLVDGGSASASEIVAGALQDSGRAILVGQKTFGKGTVQQWQELTDEAGAFRLTVAKWLTPDKTWVHGRGIVPDVVVTVPAGTPAGSDPVLDKGLEVLGAAGGAVLSPAG